MKNIKIKIITIISLIYITFLPLIPVSKTNPANPPSFFSISMLAPYVTVGNQWVTLMVEQLPKIGIGIDEFDLTSWAEIAKRTYGHTGPYPIPSYENGGFDILDIGWDLGIDPNFQGRFDTPSTVPSGENFYQYSNPVMDELIIDFTNTISFQDRIPIMKEMQKILYEDLPAITIFYPRLLYYYREGFQGWDGALWVQNKQTMENWSIQGQNNITVANYYDDFEKFHVYDYLSTNDERWLKQIYTGLLKRQAETHILEPRLVTSYSSVDGLLWQVSLDPDAKWADGTPLTADDVVFSYNLKLDPAFPRTTYCAYPWNNESVSKIDNHTLEFEFLFKSLCNEELLELELMPKHIWENIDPVDHIETAENWTITHPEKLIGTGPYKFHSYNETDNIIHLKKNPYYCNLSSANDPYFEDVYFRYYEKLNNALSDLANKKNDMVGAYYYWDFDLTEIVNTTYEYVKTTQTREFAINNEHPYLGTGDLCPIAGRLSAKHIRKAISYLIPRVTIVNEILDFNAVPGVTPVSESAVGFDEILEPYNYSIETARNEMELAGFATHSEEFSFEFVVILELVSLIGCIFFILKKTKNKR